MNNDSVTALLHEEGAWKNADQWINLVAYVASRITRNPDRELNSAEEFAKWKGGGSIGYPLNLQRLSAAALRCRWEFITSPAQDFVLNDRGFVGIRHPGWQAPALFVPLRRDSAVVIGGGARHRKQLAWQNGGWRISIPTTTIDSELTLKLNAMSWIGAREECYAARPQPLENAAKYHLSVPDEVKNLALANDYVYPILGSTLDECVADEMLLLRLLGGIRVREDSDDPTNLWI
ncbi:hypothetical protein [Arthrobacter ramosus]|uniref:hypothetical protein n=1 Tax=Arthrobacter ramosus TaxID=1672 RepID=UPI001F3FB734|nr:hypothetical protein [Arthrobacter ramosus]